MSSTHQLIVSVMIVLVCMKATTSNVIKQENIDNVKELESTHEQISISDDTPESTQQSNRGKRWLDPFGFGFSPFNPTGFQIPGKRDSSFESGVYGLDDSLPLIFRKVQEINSHVKQASFNNYQPPVAPPIPFLFPIFYIPSGDCSCNETTEKQGKADPSDPPNPTNRADGQGKVPDLDKRFPEMEDKRQNWGMVVDNGKPVDDSSFDSRPLSFEPLGPPPGARLAPPVDHGTTQGDTNSPEPVPESPPAESATKVPPPTQASSPSPDLPQSIPSSCDGAILTCCHQPQVTFECFESKGCPDPLAYGNPCEVDVILKVINRFQKFYGQRG